MKTTVCVKKEIEVKKIRASMNVRHWEDATVNGVECESGDGMPGGNLEMWNITIDTDTGTIDSWPNGTIADVHFKICDSGIYELIDADGETVFERGGYVPNCMCPEGGGYGDYVIMKIDDNGKINKWNCVLDDFQNEINEQF